MTRLRIFLARTYGVLRGQELDRDFQEEITAHLDEASEEYVQHGLSPSEARRAALRNLGGVAQTLEAHRDVRSFAWLEDAMRDVRYGIRFLGRTPGFSAVAILTLALAIGAGTALFSVIDAALLRAVPYEKPEEIVFVNVGQGPRPPGMSPSTADIDQWQATGGVFARIGMGRTGGLWPVIVDAGVPERVRVGTAAEDFLEVFGIFPIIGRAFTADDRRPGAPLVVLLGRQYWQTRLSGAPDVLGRSILVDGDQAIVVGVLPGGFYPDTMVWRPHVVDPEMRAMRGTGVPVYGRLRPGLTIEEATRDLTARFAAEGTPEVRVSLRSIYDSTTSTYGRTIAVLSGAVALILIIACANVAGLLLARGATRGPELAIRDSIGASRSRLVRQLLTESAVLASAGGLAGVVLAFLALDAIVGLIPLRLPDNVTPAVNIQVLAFALGVSALTSIVFGLAPALKLSRADLRTYAAAGRQRHGSILTRRGGQILVAIEVALVLVLVTGAALMIRSFSKILAIDVGFEPNAIVTMEVVPVDPDPDGQEAYYLRLLQSVRAIPGIAAAGAVDRPPLDGSGSYTSATIDGRSTTIAFRSIRPGYLEAVGLPLLQGRYPAEADRNSAESFAVLSNSAARAMFPDQPAVGRRFDLLDNTWTVIGVVGDARTRTPLPERPERPGLYLADELGEPSRSSAGLTVVVRPASRTPDLAGQLRRAAQEVGPPVIVERIRSGRDWFDDQVATPRQRTALLSLLGGLGLLLTLVGIFGVTAYAVARRTQEAGIRLALGARPGQLVRAIIRDAAWPLAIGMLVGLAGALGTARVIASFLFETEPTDPPTFVVVVLVVMTTALIAAWIPARRAAHVDPVKALRME